MHIQIRFENGRRSPDVFDIDSGKKLLNVYYAGIDVGPRSVRPTLLVGDWDRGLTDDGLCVTRDQIKGATIEIAGRHPIDDRDIVVVDDRTKATYEQCSREGVPCNTALSDDAKDLIDRVNFTRKKDA